MKMSDLVGVLGVDVVLDSVNAPLGEVCRSNLHQIGDFGLSRSKNATFLTAKSGRGTVSKFCPSFICICVKCAFIISHVKMFSSRYFFCVETHHR